MGKKATKATKKFASSGQLKKVIQARHRHRQILKKSQGRRGAKDGKEKAEPNDVEEDLDEEDVQKQRFACNIGRGDLLTFSEAKRP
jgi:nucleolar complex protein 2